MPTSSQTWLDEEKSIKIWLDEGRSIEYVRDQAENGDWVEVDKALKGFMSEQPHISNSVKGKKLVMTTEERPIIRIKGDPSKIKAALEKMVQEEQNNITPIMDEPERAM